MSVDDVLTDFQSGNVELADGSVSKVLAIYQRMVSGELTLDAAVPLIAAVVNRATAAAVTLADLYLTAQVEAATGVPALASGVAPTDDSERLVKAVMTVLSEPPKAKLTAAEVRQVFRDLGLNPDDYDIGHAVKNANHSIRQHINDLADFDDEELTPRERMAAHNEYGRLMGVDFLEGAVEEIDTPASIALWDRLEAGEFDGAPAVWEHAPADAAIRLERLARSEVFEAAQQATHDAMQGQDAVEGWIRQMDSNPCQLCRWWWRDGRVWPKKHRFPRHKGCNCQPRIVLAHNIKSTGYTRQLERNTA